MTASTRKKGITRNKSVSSNTSNSSSKTITMPKFESPKKNAKLSTRLISSSSQISLNTSKAMDHDKSIKLFLKSFKKLELGLNKFNSKYNNGKNMNILSSNILRTVLLPFLRSSTLKQLLQDLSYSSNPKVFQSLLSVLTSLLIKWWCTLLNALINSNNMSSIDRSVYLECVSRIFSRFEWFQPECRQWIDESTFGSYKELMVLTLDYSICRLAPIKHLPLSISAFIGKVFAYSFFKVEGVSTALLFLLNIKQAVFEDCQDVFGSSTSNCDVQKLYDIFPSHLHYLIDFKGLQNKNLSPRQKVFLNCLVPPKHPVEGIKDPTGLWVRRWFNSDGDIFNSFLRHYLDITNNLLRYSDNLLSTADDALLLKCPGLNVILTHVYQIFQVSITRISKNNSNSKLNQDFQTVQNVPLSPTPNKNNIEKQNEVFYNSIFKLFRTFRYIKYNVELEVESNLAAAAPVPNHSGTTSIHEMSSKPDRFINSTVRYLDMMLISFAKKTSIYDFNKNALLLNITYEFLNHLDIIDWTFWLNCCYLMLEKGDHVQVLLKTLSFLFNCWDKIPEILMIDGNIYANAASNLAWFKDDSESFKGNFANWLISNRMWDRFFIHWNPLVRNYYIRLIIWRVIGLNNFESSSSIRRSLAVEHKLNLSFGVFQEFYQTHKDQKFYYKPENPVVNKKMSIVSITKDELSLNDVGQGLNLGGIEGQGEEDEDISNLFNASDFKKTHPFEIFDEAIYSCTRLATEESNVESKRSNSLVNSIGRIFKLLTTDDDEEDNKERGTGTLSKLRRNKNSESSHSLNMGSRTVSVTSLSTYSLKSRSSSPSLLSFSSTPTSLTDLSEASSSLESGTSESDSYNSRLFKLPPEIVRPMHKFELIFDQDSIRDKLFLMNGQNYVYRQVNYFGLPEPPRIPSISIYLQSDSYSRFYISTDELEITTTDYNFDFETGLDTLLSSHKVSDLINLGKSLFEWNSMVNEFTEYLTSRVENDQFADKQELNEFDYFRRIIPMLTLDSSPKTLNAA